MPNNRAVGRGRGNVLIIVEIAVIFSTEIAIISFDFCQVTGGRGGRRGKEGREGGNTNNRGIHLRSVSAL